MKRSTPANRPAAPEDLTERQERVLSFIAEQIRTRGFPPTIREIGAHLGIRSTNGVNDHLNALERKGFLHREENKSRTLSVIAGGKSARALPGLAEGPGAIIDVPLLGRVAAGLPLLTEENREDTVRISSFFLGKGTKPNKVFALRVVGESMIDDGICDGDFLFVRKQATAKPGDIVVAMIDGEATVKRFFPEGDRIRFQPANARMAPIFVTKRAFRQTDILGVVVGVYRKVEARA